MRFHSGESKTSPTPGQIRSSEPVQKPGVTAEAMEGRRAALEAQKRYMEERFGRNRLVGRKPAG